MLFVTVRIRKRSTCVSSTFAPCLPLDFSRPASKATGKRDAPASEMSVYDLDRRERSLKKRTEAGSSLTLHLHPSHCRFEHQNGVFLYDSPIRSLLRSIRDGRLPTELLDLLDATDVRYFEGCLVVEVHDHREADINNSNGASGKEGQENTSSAVAGNALLGGGSGSHLGKRSNDGTLLKQAGLSSSNELNSSADPSVAASQFRFNFVNSFKRFEEARMDIQRKIEQRKARDAANAAAQAAASQQTQSESNEAASGSQPPNEMSSALHSAVAAAVAAAPEDNATATAAQQGNKSAVPVYKIVLAPDTETIWMDLLVMREGKKKKWTEREMVEMEAKILVRVAALLLEACTLKSISLQGYCWTSFVSRAGHASLPNCKQAPGRHLPPL